MYMLRTAWHGGWELNSVVYQAARALNHLAVSPDPAFAHF